jgi:hypothetical protein
MELGRRLCRRTAPASCGCPTAKRAAEGDDARRGVGWCNRSLKVTYSMHS